MSTESIAESVSISDNITISVHDIGDLKEEFPRWDSFTTEEKLKFSREVVPEAIFSTSNTSTSGLHEYIVDNLDDTQSVDDSASHLAVGDDDSTTPSTSDSNLNNETNRFSVTTTIDNGNVIDTSTFVDASQGNGNTFKEVGLVNQSSSSGDVLFNHALINSVDKTSQKTVTIDVSLTFDSA